MNDKFEANGFVENTAPVANHDANGFVEETPDQQKKRLEGEKYDKPLLAAAAGAARGLTFGGSDLAAKAVGLGDDVAKLKEYNPKASIAGEVGGAIGGAFIGPGAALAKGTLGLAEHLGGGVLARAAAGAVEGAAYGGGQAVSDLSLKQVYTPEDVAETIAADVGLGAITGGAFSLGASAIGAGAGKTGSKLKDLIAKVTPEAEESAHPSAGLFEPVEGKTAGQTRSAFQSLGGDPTSLPAGMTTDNTLIKKADSYLSENTTLAGSRKAAQYAKVISTTEDAVKTGVLDDQITRSAIEGPETVKKKLVDAVSDKEAVFKDRFDDLDSLVGDTEVSPQAKKTVAGNLLDIDEVKVGAGTPAESTAKNIAMNLEGVENIRQLRLLESRISAESRGIRSSLGEKDFQRLNVLDAAKEKVSNLIESSVERAVKDAPPEAMEQAGKTIEEYRQLKQDYAVHKKELGELGEALGVGRASSSDDLLTRLDKVNDQDLLKRAFNIRDEASLHTLKNKVPEVFETLQNRFKNSLYEKAKDESGKFQLKAFVKLVKKLDLSPEMQDLVFGSRQGDIFRNVQRVTEAIPERMFKGSASFLSFRGLMDIPAAAINNLSDEALSRAIDMAPKIEKALKFQDSVVKGSFGQFFEEAKDTAKRVNRAAAVAGLLSLSDDHEKRLNELAQVASNPEDLVNRIAANTGGLLQADNNVHSMVSEKAVQAVAFLNTKAPKKPVSDSIFGAEKWRPSDAELSKFNRYVKAVDQPLSVMEDLANRVLAPESVEAVKTLYPNLYGKITKEAVERAGNHKGPMSYQDKMQLAILLQMPTATTMHPDFIQEMQQQHPDAMKSDSEVQQGQPQQPQPKPSAMKGLNVAANTRTPTEALLGR